MVQGTRANICQKAWGSLVTSSQNLTSISQLKESKAIIIWQALPTMAGHWFKSIWKKCASPWFILTSCITVILQRPLIQRFICWAAGSYDLRWQGWITQLYCVCQFGAHIIHFPASFFIFIFIYIYIPGTGEPDGLPSVGSHRVRQDWSDLAAVAAVFVCVYCFFSN